MHRLESDDSHTPSLATSHVRAVCLLIFAFTTAGCAFFASLEDPYPLLPAPSDPNAVIVGIAVKRKPLFDSLYPASLIGEVYFVKFEQDGSSEDVMRGRIIRSNYRRDVYHYLVNAPPGRYAAIGVRPFSVHVGADAYTVLFDRALVTRLTQTVAPGTVALLGDIKVKVTWNITQESQFDDVQQHYFKNLEGKDVRTALEDRQFLGIQGPIYHVSGTFNEDYLPESAYQRFRNFLSKHLPKAWNSWITNSKGSGSQLVR
jgi:hypothetical protein